MPYGYLDWIALQCAWRSKRGRTRKRPEQMCKTCRREVECAHDFPLNACRWLALTERFEKRRQRRVRCLHSIGKIHKHPLRAGERSGLHRAYWANVKPATGRNASLRARRTISNRVDCDRERSPAKSLGQRTSAALESVR